MTILALGPTHPTVVDARPSVSAIAQTGAEIYQANCSVCHGTAGAGGTARALKGERNKKNLAQVIAFIKNPKPPMPKLYPATLNKQQVEAVAKSIESL
ncbi:MAG: c-type cytochrome [Vulcanimicrobiaceae bacterium]